MTVTNQSSSQPPQTSQPNRFHPSRVILLVTAALLLVALLSFVALYFINELLAPKPAPAFVPIANDLYHFETYAAPSVASHEVTEPCWGTLFALDKQGLDAPASYAHMYVCYLGSGNDNSSAVLENQLDEWRSKVIPADEAQVGLPQMDYVGRKRVPAVERHLIGQDNPSQPISEWYVAVTEAEGRRYGVLVASSKAQWERNWPIFKSIIANLEFESNVLP
jgi:hypothetical protein